MKAFCIVSIPVFLAEVIVSTEKGSLNELDDSPHAQIHLCRRTLNGW